MYVQNAPRAYVQNVPVYADTTRTCVSTCARVAGIHGDVLTVQTDAFQRVTPHTPHRTHTHHRHHMHTHTTSHNITRRQRLRDTEEEERETREENTRRKIQIHILTFPELILT